MELTENHQPSADSGYAPYNPQETESRWYDFWLRHNLFAPESHPNYGKRAPFIITMPPPNVTGGLHNGHTLFVTLEDIMTRWHRMLGDPSLWVPGRDHAGIAGQLVVERDLRQRGLSRHDLGREKFMDQMWEWMNSYGQRIQLQLRKLGASADWSRDLFTMDPHHVRAVRTAFVRLFEKGLIYRGHRIANWCKDCATVLSDLEVEYRDIQGQLTYFRYPVADEFGGLTGEFIPVATTRPETIVGDVGVAVHPADPRYTNLVGKHVRIPHVARLGLIVADEAVDPQFGTGAVKLTPAHDPLDFEIAQRHGLPMVNVLNMDGTMNENAGDLVALSTRVARERMLAELGGGGLLIKEEEYVHSVAHCQRSGTLLEPLLLDQWYLQIKPLAEPALEAVRSGTIRIVPDRFTKDYYRWLENIRDWCISRQLWWGHRIPVYYCEAPGCADTWASVDEPLGCRTCCGSQFHQDLDVLDTWFSSGLWPFSTLGWPDDSADMRTYYPTSVMETGYDILFFWVARMIMFGLEFTGQPPFRTVYLHGMVRASGGQKMSKVKGNVQDPLDLIESYGTDAVRLAVTIGNTPGADFTLTPGSLEARRDFVNKLWNVGRFVLANTSAGDRTASLEEVEALPTAPLADRWIVSRLSHAAAESTRFMHDYNFGEAGRVVYDFLWDEFADWYLEAFKILSRDGVAGPRHLAQVFEKTLRLLHPLMPFVTEELWQRLSDGALSRPISIMLSAWPSALPGRDAEVEEQWKMITEVVRAVRTLRADYRVEPGRWVAATIVSPPHARSFWSQHAGLIAALPATRLRPLHVVERGFEGQMVEKSIASLAGGAEVLLPAEGLFDARAEQRRTTKESSEARAQIDRLTALLARPGFAENAPADVGARERARLAEQIERSEALERRLATLNRLLNT